MTDEQVNNMPRTADDFQNYVAQSLRNGQARMDRIEADVKVNTELTAALKSDTQDVLDILTAVKGGLKVLGGLGMALRWLAVAGGSIATIWAIATGKIPPGGN